MHKYNDIHCGVCGVVWSEHDPACAGHRHRPGGEVAVLTAAAEEYERASAALDRLRGHDRANGQQGVR